MAYLLDWNLRRGAFAVPNEVVDMHLKLTSAAHLKVLLLCLRRPDQPFDPAQAAELLGLPAADIADAAAYWVQAGILQSDQPAAATQALPDAPPAPQPARTPVHARTHLTTADINRLAKNDPNIPFLLQECQMRMAKELTPAESETLAWLYSYLGLSPDCILMVVEYCKSIGRLSMRSIERTAAAWYDQGIDSHSKLESHIKRLSTQNTNEGLVKTALGLHDRELSTGQKEYIRIWCEEYGFSLEMLRLAYDKTLDRTGKVSFPYMDKILTSWHRDGIKSPKQAAEERKPTAKAKPQESTYSSFDIAELEQLFAGAEAATN